MNDKVAESAARYHIDKLVPMEVIQAYADQLAEAYHPERIILFGSYAYGDPKPESDVDLLVIMPFEGPCAKKSVEISLAVRAYFATDLLVRTPEKIEERLAIDDDFIEEILTRGRVLYEADDS